MFDEFVRNINNLWDNTYNADTWEDATLVCAILATFVASLLFVLRMVRYKGKSFLDWTLLLREIAWLFIAFRFMSSVGLDWSGWAEVSWVLWLYVALSTALALIASQREHVLHRLNQRKEQEAADAVVEKE